VTSAVLAEVADNVSSLRVSSNEPRRSSTSSFHRDKALNYQKEIMRRALFYSIRLRQLISIHHAKTANAIIPKWSTYFARMNKTIVPTRR
jgi:hypothetical protein